MRLEDLRFFVRVAELKNLSAAGRDFGLSPSAASARLVTLERTIGSQLVIRTTRQLMVTTAGKTLTKHALVALYEMDTALSLLRESKADFKGELKISSSMFFGRKHVLPYLGEFMKLHPGLTIELSFSDRLVDVIAEGFDLAIRSAELKDSSLKARKLTNHRRVLCASPDYIKKNGVPRHPDDLRQHECIGVTSIPKWRFGGPRGELSHTVPTVIKEDSGVYAHEAVLNGLGITVKSITYIWEDLRDGRLVEILPDFPILNGGEIWAVYPPGNFTDPKVSIFIDFLKSKYGSSPYWEAPY
ncbi:MAG: LysR family transcriptional regulator [Halopseudomonas aestusnigri]